MNLELHEIILLLTVAMAAGWVDAVVGGGGLIQIPALMIVFPGLPAVTALGTNKLAAIAGTSSAAYAYAQRTEINWRMALPTGLLAAVMAGFGAAAASSVPNQYFRPVVMVLLVGVLAFVVCRPSFGAATEARPVTRRRRVAAVLIAGVVIAFYDGIFGPGTGTFLIITFTALLSLDFVNSSATAKFVNAGTNLGALVVFAANEQVLWWVGLGMAVCNVIGARIGALTALKRGAGFVRMVLVVVVVGMVVRLATQYIWAT